MLLDENPDGGFDFLEPAHARAGATPIVTDDE